MTVGNFYVGYGIEISCKKLVSILGIDLEMPEMDDDEDDGMYDFTSAITKHWKKNPIVIPESGMKLKIISYPHDMYEYSVEQQEQKPNRVVIGVFTQLCGDICSRNQSQPKAEAELQLLMATGLGDEFTEMFGSEAKFMVVPDDCSCCS